MNDTEIHLPNWRNPASGPELKAKVLGKVSRCLRVRKARVLWFGFAATGGGAFVASVVFLVAPTPVTLAQVIEADAKAKSVTITNRRIMGPEKGGGYTTTRKILGKAMRKSVSNGRGFGEGNFAYSDATQSTRYLPAFNLAVVDGPLRSYEYFVKPPSINTLLRNLKAARVENNVDWNGRKVTRFTYSGLNGANKVDEVLLVDPATKLPIKFSRLFADGAWGDEFDYDYSPLEPSDMAPIVPQGTQTIDHRLVRQALKREVESKRTVMPAVLISPYEVGVLVERKKMPTKGQFVVELKVGSMEKPIKSVCDLTTIGNMLVGSQEYGLASIHDARLNWAGLRESKITSGEMTISSGSKRKTYRLSAVPVFASGDVYSLIRPFSDRFREKNKP